MPKIRNMKIKDIKTVARIVCLDYDDNIQKGFREAKEHTLDHLEIVPQHCYVIEDDDKQIIAAMVIHPQEKVFEIEDFHVMDIQRNKEALTLLKTKLMEYLEGVKTEVLCCPYAIRRLIET